LFGSNPYPFYAYNVVASTLGILFSEPTSGAFLFTRGLLAGEITTAAVVNVVTSLVTTAVMIWFVARRWRSWLNRDFSHEDRLFLVFVAVCAGNAAISFPYVKDVTLSTGGAFYAPGTFAALTLLASEISDRRVSAFRAAIICGALALASAGWTIRAASFYIDMNQAAYKAQSDWQDVYGWLNEQHIVLQHPEQKRLVETLRMQMTQMKPPALPLLDLVR
jgi:hypothetical protein